jgi:hypothetical protein
MLPNYLNKIIFVIVLASLFSLCFIGYPDCAQAGIWDGIDCRKDGNCELSDFTRILVNVAQWILGISGSLALLALVYGGVLFLISGGSSETVAKAKRIITGAVIGLIIVFASYTIIAFILNALGIEENWFKGVIIPGT